MRGFPIYYSAMLSRLVKEHQSRQSKFKEEQEKRKKDALESVKAFTSSLVDALNSEVEQAYENQKRLDQETKKLQAQATRYMKQAQQWKGLVEGFHKALKDLGDLEQWARTIEADMNVVVSTLEYAYRGPSGDAGSANPTAGTSS